jgi:uncharacterized protein (DUF488 family)
MRLQTLQSMGHPPKSTERIKGPTQAEAACVGHPDSNFTGQPSYRSVATIYTIGHSTRTLDELVAALQGHGVKRLVDIRAFPMSRRLPHFNRESLEQELPKHGIAYVWMKELGGRRKKIRDESPNTGLRNESFRNYADYMMTGEFVAGIERLVEIAGQGKTAIMCAERVWFQCHRMLVGDYLTAQGHTVLHIDDEKHAPRPHKLMKEARVADGMLVYNGQQLF